MNEAITGIVVLVAVSIFAATLAFLFIRSFWAAEIIAVVFSAALFQAAAYLHVGYLDPFWEIAVVLSAPVVVITCAIVGVCVRTIQSRREAIHREAS